MILARDRGRARGGGGLAAEGVLALGLAGELKPLAALGVVQTAAGRDGAGHAG